MNRQLLHGLSSEHIKTIDKDSLQEGVHPLLNQLKEEALNSGLKIQAISTYRSFEQQKYIWNEKAQGNRVLLDIHSKELDFPCLSLEQIMHAILRWSALPGLSRHHWGTDLDIVDLNALNEHPDYKVQLIPSEYEQGGIFEDLGRFLNSSILSRVGFFRPYSRDLGGVSPEPWHLSSKQHAREQEELLTLQTFNEWLYSQELKDLRLLDTIKENGDEIFERYVSNTQSNPMA